MKETNATFQLTPEEIDAVKNATPEECAEALIECVTDRNFWLSLLTAFFEGILRGVARR